MSDKIQIFLFVTDIIMLLQTTVVHVNLVTVVKNALKLLPRGGLCMSLKMLFQVTSVRKLFVTVLTFERLFTRVDSSMAC